MKKLLHNSVHDLPVDRQSLVGAHPHFYEIDDEYWLDAVNSAKQVFCASGTVLYDGRAQDTACMILLMGTIRVYMEDRKGKEITLFRYGPGDLCLLNISSSFDQLPFDCKAKAETDVFLLGVSRSHFERAVSMSDKFCSLVMQIMSERLTELVFSMDSMVFQRLDQRLVRHLRMLNRNQSEITQIVTHKSLAADLGVSREAVSRVMKEFERRKLVKLDKGKIIFLSE